MYNDIYIGTTASVFDNFYIQFTSSVGPWTTRSGVTLIQFGASLKLLGGKNDAKNVWDANLTLIEGGY